jgi:hypothetical protein
LQRLHRVGVTLVVDHKAATLVGALNVGGDTPRPNAAHRIGATLVVARTEAPGVGATLVIALIESQRMPH